RLEGEREMPRGDDDPANEHGTILAEQLIRDQSADDRRRPGAAGIGAIDRRGARVRESQPAGRRRRDHGADQKRSHPVIAEALPHLGEKEGGESAWMSEEPAVSRGWDAHRQGVYSMVVGCRLSVVGNRTISELVVW